VKLHIREWGDPDAPPVICLHGATAHGGQFARLAEERLAERFHVIAPDLRGYGRSAHEPPWTLEEYVDDVLALAPESALWIGMSVMITTYTLASGMMTQGMTWWQAMVTILLGNSIVLVPMVLNAHAGTKYGISFPVLCRASFGVRGANVAAVLRTAEGLGLSRVHVVPHDARDDAAHRRVTQDAHKWLDVEAHASGALAARRLRESGFAVWAGHLDRAARLYSELPADRPMALLFGNEHEGPSPETLAACTGTFRIPMAGFTQSFNVSVAAGIALAHLAGARRRLLGRPGDLSEEARVQLRDRFTLLAAKLARRMKPRP